MDILSGNFWIIAQYIIFIYKEEGIKDGERHNKKKG